MKKAEYKKRVGFLENQLRHETGSDKWDTEKELKWLRENKEDVLSGRKEY